MPTLSQGDKTGDYRISWGYKEYTHMLKDGLSLKDARQRAQKWAKSNSCKTKVEGWDIDKREWILFSEYDHTKKE